MVDLEEGAKEGGTRPESFTVHSRIENLFTVAVTVAVAVTVL